MQFVISEQGQHVFHKSAPFLSTYRLNKRTHQDFVIVWSLLLYWFCQLNHYRLVFLKQQQLYWFFECISVFFSSYSWKNWAAQCILPHYGLYVLCVARVIKCNVNWLLILINSGQITYFVKMLHCVFPAFVFVQRGFVLDWKLSVFSAKHLVLVPTKAGIVFLKTSQISCVLMEAKWIHAFKEYWNQYFYM